MNVNGFTNHDDYFIEHIDEREILSKNRLVNQKNSVDQLILL